VADPTPIRACICHNKTFAEVKRLADVGGWATMEEIAAKTGCGSGCGLCRPYLQRMLETGETAFAWIPPEQAEE
jgi:bacterioferritin-associated ferredoxin